MGLLLLPWMAEAVNPQIEMFQDFPVFNIDMDRNSLPDCGYADIEEISTLVPINKLSILFFNVRSCRKNFDTFWDILLTMFLDILSLC